MKKRVIGKVVMSVTLGAIAAGAMGSAAGAISKVSESFKDGSAQPLWITVQSDPPNMQITEQKGMYFTEQAAAMDSLFAGYISNKWGLDPRQDFALRIQVRFDMAPFTEGEVGLDFGLVQTVDAVSLELTDALVYSIGRNIDGTFAGYELYDAGVLDDIDYDVEADIGEPAFPSKIVKAYFLWNAASKTLIVGDRYGDPDGDQHFLPDLDTAKPIMLYLGAYSEGNAPAIQTGSVYFKQVKVDQGVIVGASPVLPVLDLGPNDVNDDGAIDVCDVADLLVHFGEACTGACTYDIDADDVVGAGDLLMVLEDLGYAPGTATAKEWKKAMKGLYKETGLKKQRTGEQKKQDMETLLDLQ